MKIAFTNLFVFCLLICSYFAQAQRIDIRTNDVQLTFTVDEERRLVQSYFGRSLATSQDTFHQRRLETYIAWGTYDLFEPALRVTHPDGNPALSPRYIRHHATTNANGIVTTRIELRDSVYPVTVVLVFETYPQENVIRTWTEISHTQRNPMVLNSYASNMIHLNATTYWLTQFSGDWCRELGKTSSQLTPGMRTIDSKLGTRAHLYQTPAFMVSLDGVATETNGEVLAGTLEWTGNFRFVFEIDNLNSLRIISGINPFASDYHLPRGEVFTTPPFVFTYSAEGKGQASRNIHRWARRHAILDGTGSRMTLLNNWEATFFDFNEDTLKRLFVDARNLGVDLFLLDDGWFGNKYPRANDRAGLGDWQVNREKLPNGIAGLIREANAAGVKFGIWIEPEMVNPQSELYQRHPDWVMRLPNRPNHLMRHQMVLDVANPRVQDFIFNTVDQLLTQNPGIAYIKWDANRFMTNTFSPFLRERQSHVFVEYQRGLHNIMRRLRAKYPNLPIMLCSSGGGRIDYGTLRYFTEFWPSDNTDGLERVYIQWGYSYFYPAVVLGAHVTSWGKQSIKFRTDVAMSGRLGFDIDIQKLTEAEREFCRQAVVNYNRIAPVVQQGDLYRLVSPYDEPRAVFMYVNDSKDHAVLFSYTTNARFRERFALVRLQGLDPKKIYDVREINTFEQTSQVYSEGTTKPIEFLSISGKQLMTEGIPVSSRNAIQSRIFEITVSK